MKMKTLLSTLLLSISLTGVSYANNEDKHLFPSNSEEGAEFTVHLALEHNNANALWVLGSVSKKSGNYKQALDFFNRSAKQGYADAQVELSLMYLEGEGVVKDAEKGGTWLIKALKKGNASAQRTFGMIFQSEEDYEEAVKWYRKAAIQGDAKAQVNLGAMYGYGQGVIKDDKQAVKWYLKAANQNESAAQYNLAQAYFSGIGVVKDDKQAVKWYLKAANQGRVEAQYNLGLMYFRGGGVLKDYKEAFKWFHKAANQDYANAQYYLGLMYSSGKGVTKDLSKAKHWIKKSYENPNSSTSTVKLAKDKWKVLELWKY